MCAHCNSAVNVCNNKIAIFILLSKLTRMVSSHRFLVQHVRVGNTINTLDSRESRIVAILIDICGIECESFLPVFLCKCPGDHDTQLSRMLGSADSRHRIVEQLLIDFSETTRLRAGAASASHKSVDLIRIYIFLCKHVQNDAASERQLVVHMFIFQKLRRVVEQVLLKQTLLIQKKADLSRCRARIDYKQFLFIVRHFLSLIRLRFELITIHDFTTIYMSPAILDAVSIV